MVAVFQIKSESLFMNVCRTFDYIGMQCWYSRPRLPTRDLQAITRNLSSIPGNGDIQGLSFSFILNLKEQQQGI